ncbi:MAG: hypothetical protein COB15_06990 [Flavobacteriales bacterium]|nr:MAG: hypothetical protein COB15_06990 [Flavobacteriales bacterium]
METIKTNETKKVQLGLFILGSILFNWFFWKEELGLNLLLYNIFIIGTLSIIYPKSIKEKRTLLMVSACTITALMVFFYGSTISKVTNLTSLLIFIGYVHQPQIKSIFFAGFTSILNFFRFPIKQIFKSLNKNNTSESAVITSLKKIKLVVIPLIFLFIFYWIFKAANPKFDIITKELGDKISILFEWLFSDISWIRIPFFLFGCIIIAAFIYHENITLYLNKEIGFKDIIKRKRKKRVVLSENEKRMFQPKVFPLSIGLKNEYRSAIILVGMVNLLLFFINYLDVSWLWFDFEYKKDLNLSQFVHEGTYLLILSILLSMGIILYFFRRNLNFLPKNKLIKQLSILWIFQNMILVISVGLRNFYYIQEYGLAYKRIGVIVFLLLTLIGLITLIFKITKLKSAFCLIKINSIAVYSSFIFLSLFNWDIIIANHNLSNLKSRKVDVTFLLTLSENTLPLIDKHSAILDTKGVRYQGGNHHFTFNWKVQHFLEKQKDHSWLSMNLSKLKTIEYFNNTNTFYYENK